VTEHVDEEPQHDEGDHHKCGDHKDDAEEEEPIGPDLAAARIVLSAFEQSDVPAIGFPGGVERVSEEGNCADESVEADVGDHARDGYARESALPCGEDDEERCKAAECVAQSGDQPYQRIQSEADAGSGHVKDVVEQRCNKVELLVGEPAAGLQWRQHLWFGGLGHSMFDAFCRVKREYPEALLIPQMGHRAMT
jgi:hypothetical protein